MLGKLIMTVEQMQDRNAWLAMRNKGIGGSEAAVIAGFSQWKSPLTLWLEKTGQCEPEDLSGNNFVKWGTKLEALVAEAFCEETGKRVRRQGMVQDNEYPFMFANVDRIVVGENAGLECKTTNAFADGEWEDDDIPDAYYCQCQWYMGITGADKWYIACLIGGNKFVHKCVERNAADIEALRMAAVDFWSLVETGLMPAVDGSKSCAAALAEKFPGINTEIELPPAARDCLSRLWDVKQTIQELEVQQRLYENQLKAMLGDAETGIIDGNKITWKPQAGKITIDSKALKAELPEIYKKYSKQGKAARILRIPNKRKEE